MEDGNTVGMPNKVEIYHLSEQVPPCDLGCLSHVCGISFYTY